MASTSVKTHDNAHEVRTDPAARGTQEAPAQPAPSTLPHAEYIRQVCTKALELIEREGLDYHQALGAATREVDTRRHPQPELDHTTTPDPLAYLGDDIEARALFRDANNFIGIVFTMLDPDTRAALEAKNPHLWRVQRATGWNRDRAVQHFGFVLALEELAKHPDVLQAAVREFFYRVHACLPFPFALLESLDPNMKRDTIELMGRLLEKE